MRIVAIINQKGGCGKTTTSINLAACLASLGNKTLLVDMDPQGHCGVGLAVPEEQIERTVYDALIEPSDGKIAEIPQIVWQIASDFDLVPANIRLAAFEQVFSHRAGRDERLKAALDKVRSVYQWCVIDCPPSVGLLTFNALKACDQVIVPVETGYFSLHGLAKMMETLEVLRQRCGRDILVRILPTLYDTRTKLAREVLSELRSRFRQYLMESTVNFNTKLKEAASFGQPITEYDPGSRGYKDFVNLAKELMGQDAADNRPVADDRLSRPAELVQRAKQLAQLTNAQFGRTVIAQPPAPAPAPGIAPKPKPVEPTPVAKTPEVAPQALLRLTAGAWPPAAEMLLPKELLPSISVVGGDESFSKNESFSATGDSFRISGESSFLISSPTLLGPGEIFHTGGQALRGGGEALRGGGEGLRPEIKSTQQKIEEFYGVKQIGADVLFAAHFDQARSVYLAGDFNNWTPQTTPMVNGERPGDWRKILPLAPGRYKYRLVVDGAWITDPNNTYVEVNQFGEFDNVVEVKKAAVTAIAA